MYEFLRAGFPAFAERVREQTAELPYAEAPGVPRELHGRGERRGGHGTSPQRRGQVEVHPGDEAQRKPRLQRQEVQGPAGRPVHGTR